MRIPASAAHHRCEFRPSTRHAEWWDPFTGRVSQAENAANIDLSLQPYESRLIFLTNSMIKPEISWKENAHSSVLDLSNDWDLTFSGLSRTIHMATLHSWSDDESFKYYSGQVAYEKVIDLPAHSEFSTLILDFGRGRTRG